MANRAGEFRTNLSGEAAYKSFVPSPLPPGPVVEMVEEMVEKERNILWDDYF